MLQNKELNMTPENFVYWLNGYLELSDAQSISYNQLKVIKEHLAIVMNKVTSRTIEITEGDAQMFKIPPEFGLSQSGSGSAFIC